MQCQALRHAHSSLDLFDKVIDSDSDGIRVLKTGESPRLIAQKDLIDYAFAEIVSSKETGAIDSKAWARVLNVYERIVRFDKNGDCSPSPIPDNYWDLPQPRTDETVICCDYKRFNHTHSCDGKTPITPPLVCGTMFGVDYKFSDSDYECMDPKSSGIVSHYTLIQTRGLIIIY